MNKYYITTPIYYANDNPHIGHIATTVFSDIIARYHKLQGEDILFLTGLDEHGEKVALAAQKAKKDPQQFVDELAKKWQSYWEKLNIKYDIFMRTTNPEHAKIVGELLTQLKENGDIYRATYKGVYCIGCEEFKADRDLVNGLCPEHHPDQVCQKEEENYFFKLSKYIPEIKKGIADGIIPLEPESKRKEILARLEEEVRDLSISRQNVPWGIKLPWDEIQTVYVWVEALINYFSATKIYKKEEFWPADLHFLGKGNNWFHSVIWPALLLALKLPLPKKIFVTGYYNIGGKKVGKSLGNAISAENLLGKYGVDGTRYLLTASMPYSTDTDVDFPWFDEKYNSDLANGLGNLVARVAKLCENNNINIGNELPCDHFDVPIELALEEFKLNDALYLIWEKISLVDKEINLRKPWDLKGEDVKSFLIQTVFEIQDIAYNLQPFLPETSEKILKQFSGEIKSAPALFPRL
ncbi:MAG: Methionine-tRNA ligase [Candidatus Daviesbacteria bacterium GW2011_GWB1_41_5]|nr:MAG: Methionine-tRNA ligase [Candidatus Daviesbacteria bacterium GW2011_GWB1_41_5]